MTNEVRTGIGNASLTYKDNDIGIANGIFTSAKESEYIIIQLKV